MILKQKKECVKDYCNILNEDLVVTRPVHLSYLASPKARCDMVNEDLVTSH